MNNNLIKIPSQTDMSEVQRLQAIVNELEKDLSHARYELREAWSLVPVDESILHRPYKTDISVACVKCGVSTRWRVPRLVDFEKYKAVPECSPFCNAEERDAKRVVNSNVMSILTGP